MEAEEKIRLKEEIEKKLKSVRESVLQLRENSKPVAPDNSIGRITRMDAIQSKSVNEALLRDAETQEFRLQETLARINETDFGVCRRCKKPIAFERMMAIPQTPFCISCASAM